MRKVLVLLVISVITLSVIACGSDTASDSESGVIPATSHGPSAIDFSLPVVNSVDGNIQSSTFSLSANRGKSTVLYFSFAG